MKDTYYVHCSGASLEVYRAGRIELADNGQPGDRQQSILAAFPVLRWSRETDRLCPTLGPHLIITTSGDDYIIGWIEDGTVIVADDITPEFFESFNIGEDADLQEWLESISEPLVAYRFARY